MPRLNRLERARNHQNPLVGCIMALQERIKILGRSIVGCRCPEHESNLSSLQEKVSSVEDNLSSVHAELSSLRDELSSLQEKYKSLSSHNKRLRTFIKNSGEQYRQRIKILSLDNSSKCIQEICQDKAYHGEIVFLRSHVNQLKEVLIEHDISVPSPPPPCPWKLDVNSRSPAWNINPSWSQLHPGVYPPDQPNNSSSHYSQLIRNRPSRFMAIHSPSAPTE
jgi:regulator of replication initiation timing